MEDHTTAVGLDVHLESIFAAALPLGFETCPEEQQLPNDVGKLVKWLRRVEAKWGKLRVVYEASAAGYVLQRRLAREGFVCDVAAPALIPKKPGDRKKNDRRDARHLAKQHQARALTLIRIPTESDEAVRSLVRLHRQLTEDILRVRQRILKHCRRNDKVFTGTRSNWTKKHVAWLEGLKLAFAEEQLVLRSHLERLAYLQAQLEEVDTQIQALAFSERFAESAGLLMCFRGFRFHSSMVLSTEVGDFRRFPKAQKFMDFVGITPSERSSGTCVRRGGITKTGNSYCRHILIQAAWALVQSAPRAGQRLQKHWEGQPAWAVALAQRAMKRLHRRFWALVNKGKKPNVAVVAVARELAGFVWAMMQGEPTPATVETP